jgi:hypothetical protein
MYFPFVYGRRSEFLALRGMLDDHRSLEALVPVIEPVKRKSSDLARCIKEFGKAGQTLAVILNPDKHELKAKDEAKAWLNEVLKVVDENDSILPTFRCISTTTVAHVSSFLNRFEDRDVALAYSSPALTDAELKTLTANANVRFHIVLNGKMTAAQQKLLPSARRVDIRDYFNKLDRNSDYDGAELFTDRYKTLKPSWAGFGDYAAIGSSFTPGGGQPAAVAIHAVYKHKSTDVWIEHFVSDDTDKDVGSTEDKFLQAARKLVKAAKARPKEFGSNFALDEYASHVAASHFPGLGTNKVLQLEHHICLMLDLLAGTL